MFNRVSASSPAQEERERVFSDYIKDLRIENLFARGDGMTSACDFLDDVISDRANSTNFRECDAGPSHTHGSQISKSWNFETVAKTRIKGTNQFFLQRWTTLVATYSFRDS